MERLEGLVDEIRQTSGLQSKRDIGRAMAQAAGESPVAAVGGAGDDCAALPDGDGYLLFAIEGLIQSFVERDPWFAGYSAVMVNLSDVAAMGGRPLAVADALWARSAERFAQVWAGMRAASERYGVPIVGGHSNIQSAGDQLAVSVVGRAKNLLTSFDAQPGDNLVVACDLRGTFREPHDFWNASTEAPPTRLRGDFELLPRLAEDGLAKAAKDISMGGVLGTVLMLAECSGVGAAVDLDAVPRPDDVPLERWLVSFPSYGYVLACPPANTDAMTERFRARGIACAAVGRIQQTQRLEVGRGSESACFWDLEEEPLMGMGPRPSPADATLSAV